MLQFLPFLIYCQKLPVNIWDPALTKLSVQLDLGLNCLKRLLPDNKVATSGDSKGESSKFPKS